MRPLSLPSAGASAQTCSRPSRIRPFRLQMFLLMARAAAAVGRGELRRDHVATVVVLGLVEAIGAGDLALRLVAACRQHESEQPKSQPPPQDRHSEPSTPPKNRRPRQFMTPEPPRFGSGTTYGPESYVGRSIGQTAMDLH